MKSIITDQGHAATAGLVACLVGFPLLAGLAALFYRFPVPMAGYVSGPAGVIPAALGSLFYLGIGGVFILIPLGVLVGLASWRYRRVPSQLKLSTVLYGCLVVDLPIVLLLAVWDKIYGPW